MYVYIYAGEIDGGSAPWMIVYQLLLVLEKLYVTLPEITDDVFMNKIIHTTTNEMNSHKSNKDDNDEDTENNEDTPSECQTTNTKNNQKKKKKNIKKK